MLCCSPSEKVAAIWAVAAKATITVTGTVVAPVSRVSIAEAAIVTAVAVAKSVAKANTYGCLSHCYNADEEQQKDY